MSTFAQDDRTIGIETPLGPEKLFLESFSGEEHLSGLFRFSLSLISDDRAIKSSDILGKSVSFYVLKPDGAKRWFNGVVNQFGSVGENERAKNYSAEVVPWMWFLTKGSDCRVFECEKSKDVKDIIDALLKDLGFSDYKWDVKRSLAKREYCIQYRETHFDYLSRLLEEEGIYYYFKHSQGKHELILSDHIGGVYDCAETPIGLASQMYAFEDADNLSSWSHGFQYTSGKWSHTDYDFENPTTPLSVTTTSKISHPGNSKLEFYDHPADYVEKGAGNNLLKLRMEEEEVAFDTISASGTVRSFSPGVKFAVDKHPDKAEVGKKWVITAVEHRATVGGSFISGGQSGGQNYVNSFRAIPADVVFRPARTRQKPRLMGIQSAVIVGPAGDEIYTDKYGRVKIQFHWDRKGKNDDKSSLWVRVATPWAGKQWGMVQIPRIGQEVIVSFLEGDPDRPVITGMLYNAENMPPYALPDNKTQSGVKTRSSMDGSDENFNEIRFEDKKDGEEIYVHAEKDFNCVIENNETRKVGFEDKEAGDQEIEIYNDQKFTVGVGSKAGSQMTTIYKDRMVELETGNDSLVIKKGNLSVLVKSGNVALELGQGNQETVLKQGNQSTELKMGNQKTVLKMGNQEVKLSMGNQTTKLDLGASKTEAMQAIELKVGANSIKIDQTGVTIKGLMVKVEGTAMASFKAPMSKVSGDAMLTVKGGITMIN